jgi:Cu2+-exporting ATPase
MKTVTLEVTDLLSILDFAAVEKRLARFAGVHGVAINAGSSSASIEYDDLVTTPERLVEQIRACGFHCRGEMAPRHVCVPDETLVVPRRASA